MQIHFVYAWYVRCFAVNHPRVSLLLGPLFTGRIGALLVVVEELQLSRLEDVEDTSEQDVVVQHLGEPQEHVVSGGDGDAVHHLVAAVLQLEQKLAVEEGPHHSVAITMATVEQTHDLLDDHPGSAQVGSRR